MEEMRRVVEETRRGSPTETGLQRLTEANRNLLGAVIASLGFHLQQSHARHDTEAKPRTVHMSNGMDGIGTISSDLRASSQSHNHRHSSKSTDSLDHVPGWSYPSNKGSHNKKNVHIVFNHGEPKLMISAKKTFSLSTPYERAKVTGNPNASEGHNVVSPPVTAPSGHHAALPSHGECGSGARPK
ncbi:hypothetical protein RRG08_010153 [Elysia crispata]|uniref:Uncharacterized protein n=1 Tax=Elysia crispata TaxID=231223 RepID=A0AAE1AJP9_9GAST|nr:hypothetical protein RRG08_010153 [Elysia crispata]